MLRVHFLKSSDLAGAAQWDEFVEKCGEATFFHRAGWQVIMEEVFRHPTYYLYAERDGRIEGVLPMAHVKSWLFGNSLVSLPFTVYAGVAADTGEAASTLEAEAEKIALRLKVAHLEYRNVAARHPDWPTQGLYVTFRKNIDPDEEVNMLAIPRKQRAMVRKGIKGGLIGQIDSNTDRFFALYASNVHRHGTPSLPKKYFDALMRIFGPACEILIVTTADGQALSSVLTFYFRDEVMPYYAGDDERARDSAANDFKYWDLMRRSCARGLKVFDYGRSKIGTGTYAFKKHWGFEPQPLHYEYRLYKREAIPQNNPNNAKFSVLISTWRRMPLAAATWLGPHIVRSLG